MSTSAFKQYQKAFSDENWVKEVRKWVGNELLDEDTHTFAVAPTPNKFIKISEGRWKLLVGHAVNIIVAMSEEETTTMEELQNAYRYLFVCINCIKYGLDPKAAKIALNIEEYENKYWRKSC